MASQVAHMLGEDRCVVVGGLAVGAHGFVRATDDVDLVVDYPLSEARRRLKAHGVEARTVRGDVLEGGFPCLKGTLEGIPVDVLPPLVPLDWEKAVEVSIDEGRLRIVDLEGLFRLKLRARGVQDLLDVAVLALRHPEHRERAREIAAAYRVLDRLDAFLSDRRTQATAAEQKAREGRPRQARRRRARRV